MLRSNFKLEESDISERFVRASGPGGQNVNKVATDHKRIGFKSLQAEPFSATSYELTAIMPLLTNN